MDRDLTDDLAEALKLMFKSYEDGLPCYENADEKGAFVGFAMHLDLHEYNRVCDVLERYGEHLRTDGWRDEDGVWHPRIAEPNHG